MPRFLIAAIFLGSFCLGCGKEKPQTVAPARTKEQAQLIKAFFNSPLKGKGEFDGFWSVSVTEFSDFIAKSRSGASTSPPIRQPVDARNSRYFLRIEGSYCDELFFIDGADFTVSAGTLKKLEVAKDRTAYAVVFNRKLQSGIKLTQGAVLSVYRKEKRLVLEFSNHTLTFFPEAEDPALLAQQYGISL